MKKMLVGEKTILGRPLPDKNCAFCGAVLQQITYSNDLLTVYTPAYNDCQCSGATSDREHAIEAEAKKEYEAKRQMHIEKVKMLTRGSGIRGRYLEKSLDNFRVENGNEKAFKTALKYVEKFTELLKTGQGLYITGSFGVGKTHLATGIAKALIESEYKVICKPSINLLADIRATYDKEGEQSEYTLLRDYLKADLLIIDDLGKESITDWSLSMLYTILNMRYEDSRPLIITTNYSDTELIERLSRKGDKVTAASMVSRLHEISFEVPVGGIDHRSGK